MALVDDLTRMMGYDQGPDNNAEVNIKIKPLGSTAAQNQQNAFAPAPSEPTAGIGTTGAGATPGGAAPPTPPGSENPTPQNPFFGPGGTTAVPTGMQVRKTNPTLVTHPLGARTDDLYEAAVAQLQFDTQQRYANLLQELGFMDEQGNFIPGTLETQATRQRNEITRQRELSLQDVIENAVRGGTVFSGRRAQLTAQAQQPFDTAIANLTTDLSRQLAQRYQGLGDLTRQFELSRNQLIADAAQRYAQSLLAAQAAGAGGDRNVPGGNDPYGTGALDQMLNNLNPAALSAALSPASIAQAIGQIDWSTAGQDRAAGAPTRPKGMPSNWTWNAAKGYWQSPDGKFFLMPGQPWSQTTAGGR